MMSQHQQQVDNNQGIVEGREKRTIEFLKQKDSKDSECLKNILQ